MGWDQPGSWLRAGWLCRKEWLLVPKTPTQKVSRSLVAEAGGGVVSALLRLPGKGDPGIGRGGLLQSFPP